METPLTPGMSSLLYFGDETFEYPALENGATPGTKGSYEGNSLSRKDLEEDNRLIENFASRRLRSSHATNDSDSAAHQTPALTTGPSANYHTSSSTSQTSPSVAPDYFSRPRQPHSDGSIAHFNTSRLAESTDFSQFRDAINNRFKAARASARENTFNDDSRQPFLSEGSRDFSFSEYHSQPQHDDDYRHAELDAALESIALETEYDLRPPQQSGEGFEYPELDPALEAGPLPPPEVTVQQPPSPTTDTTTLKPAQPPPVVPVKRRRRRKAPPSAEVQAQKHKAFLERNREAASKCRTKKKTQIQQLEEDERDGRALNQLLKDQFKDILGEVLLLREQVKLREMACGGECGVKEEQHSMDGVVHGGDKKLEDQGLAKTKTDPPEWESGSETDSDIESDEDQVDHVEKKRRKEPTESVGDVTGED